MLLKRCQAGARSAKVVASMVEPSLRIGAFVPATTAEGPFTRFALWVQGCSLGCAGCCNPAMQPSVGGRVLEVRDLVHHIDVAMRDHGIEGVTVVGGEPLQQLEGLTALLRAVRERGLGVLVFSGYRLDEALAMRGFAEAWALVDTLVDGRFDAREPDRVRRFIGSRNQTLRHRTDRYADPRLWAGPDLIELRIGPDGTASIHGAPGPAAALSRAVRRSSSPPRSC